MAFPVTKEANKKIESLVATITSEFFGVEIYKSAEEKALAFFYFIIRDHPFIDGSKRTFSGRQEAIEYVKKPEIKIGRAAWKF